MADMAAAGRSRLWQDPHRGRIHPDIETQTHRMLENASRVSLIALLTPSKRAAFLRKLTEEEIEAFEQDWPRWARPNQLPPAGEWRTWLLLAGRGFGKTRTGAEYIRT